MQRSSLHLPGPEVLKQLGRDRGVADPTKVTITPAEKTTTQPVVSAHNPHASRFAAKRDPRAVNIKNLPPPAKVQVDHNFIDLSRDNVEPRTVMIPIRQLPTH